MPLGIFGDVLLSWQDTATCFYTHYVCAMLAIPKKIGSLLGQRDTNRLLAGGWLGYVEICDFLPACCAFLSTRVRSWSACC